MTGCRRPNGVTAGTDVPEALRTQETCFVMSDALNSGLLPDGACRQADRRPARRRPRRSRRGLIGILLSIIVVVAVIIAIFAIYNQVTASANAAQTALFVRQLAPQVTNQYRGDYTGLSEATAISSGFVPDNWRNGNTITDPDGATVTIRGGSRAGRFLITFKDGVPVQTCKAVLGAVKSDPTFINATVGGAAAARSNVDTAGGINTACAKSADGDFIVRFN